ncbi:MAG: alpha/beta hydrolase-fold protein, partial [Acidobacteriota bacterium]
LDPATGKVLWSHEHGGDQGAMGGGTLIPLPAGDDRIFLMHRNDASVMLQVTAAKEGGDGFEISELWSNNVIRSSYVHPVIHEGHLYGMSGRIFTCADAATGERKWRSRQPGDGFPTLVGDHLVIITKPGTLHVVEANPEAYTEVAQIELFDEHAWSAVAFQDGHLYARSMGHLARIDAVGDAAESASAKAWLASTEFGAFLSKLEKESDKNAAIERYLADQASFPIIEENGVVHFVYRGEAEDVGIVGDMIGFRREDPMIRVAGTDLFYYSTLLEPDAAVTYGFIPSYETPIADPLNPQLGRGLFGEVSWFSMPAFQQAEYDGAATDGDKGRLEIVEWTSEAREGQDRKATVYLPKAYDADSERRFQTLYVHDGQGALEGGDLDAALDYFIGSKVEPVIAVFVMPPEENPRGDARDPAAYSKMVAEELVPLIDGRFRTVKNRNSRASAGAGGGGTSAMGTAFAYPEVFSKIVAHAPTMIGLGEIGAEIPSSEEHLFQIYQSWGAYHLRSPHEAWDMAESNRELWNILRERGYRPAGGENSGGFGWATWRAQVGDWLTALFPAGS